jgi:hypothetical protein
MNESSILPISIFRRPPSESRLSEIENQNNLNLGEKSCLSRLSSSATFKGYSFGDNTVRSSIFENQASNQNSCKDNFS